ncbi:MAG: threonylcarbamoyl-AMP synthase, partial [Opitutales bacterium]|nr:threonylcarbamoyl-AMP synthase [Opitutales bacterium]
MAKLLKPTDQNLRFLREFLLSGGVAALPTETVYGLAANAMNPEACQKVFDIKNRPSLDPLICHVPGFSGIETYCDTNSAAEILCPAFWPGPLTIVLKKKPIIPDIVTAGLDSVAVRSPSHPDFRRLMVDCPFPIAAPSANPFSYISPTRADHVNVNLGEKIEYILDGGPCSLGVESTIIDARDPRRPKVLRYGALPLEDIENALGCHIEVPAPTSKSFQIAPGSLPKHYSPRIPVELRVEPVSEKELQEPDSKVAYLLLRKPNHETTSNIHWLSETGNLDEIAKRLYAKLREVDTKEYEKIVAEETQELGLGQAINDRLRRAS